MSRKARVVPTALDDQPAALAVWIRDRASGHYVGELRVTFDPDMDPKEVQRRIATFYAALARDHPEREAIPMSEPRPAEPSPPAA